MITNKLKVAIINELVKKNTISCVLASNKANRAIRILNDTVKNNKTNEILIKCECSIKIDVIDTVAKLYIENKYIGIYPIK